LLESIRSTQHAGRNGRSIRDSVVVIVARVAEVQRKIKGYLIKVIANTYAKLRTAKCFRETIFLPLLTEKASTDICLEPIGNQVIPTAHKRIIAAGFPSTIIVMLRPIHIQTRTNIVIKRSSPRQGKAVELVIRIIIKLLLTLIKPSPRENLTSSATAGAI